MAEEPMVKRYVVGYALALKKQASFIQPSLVNLAREKGIDLMKIDTEKKLVDQGPFDCLLHKLYDEDWKQQLFDYSIKNPNCLIIDSPEAIQRLHNRVSMLQVVSELNVECTIASFGVPKQSVIYEAISALEVNAECSALKFPVIAKPLVADGSAKSHKMLLVYNNEGLNELKPPIVLQEFVNHGGVIFKVYVVGDHVKCVKRKSLPDVNEENSGNTEGSLSFSQVSNLNDFEENFEKYYNMMHLRDIEYPPMELVTNIARGLREATKLHFFNFDVIRDTSVGDRYLVIDINYFPGYAKMPDYETILTDFFCDVLTKRDQGMDNLRVVDSEDEKKVLGENTTCVEDEKYVSVSSLEREEQENS